MMRSGNPVLRRDTFTKVRSFDSAQVMTIQGTTNKTLFLLALTIISTWWVWSGTVLSA